MDTRDRDIKYHTASKAERKTYYYTNSYVVSKAELDTDLLTSLNLFMIPQCQMASPKPKSLVVRLPVCLPLCLSPCLATCLGCLSWQSGLSVRMTPKRWPGVSSHAGVAAAAFILIFLESRFSQSRGSCGN